MASARTDEDRDRHELAKRKASWARPRILVGILVVLIVAIVVDGAWTDLSR